MVLLGLISCGVGSLVPEKSMAWHSSLGVHSRADWQWCLNQSAVHSARVLHLSLLQRAPALTSEQAPPWRDPVAFLLILPGVMWSAAFSHSFCTRQPCTSARPQLLSYHPGKRHLALHLTLQLQGPPCSPGAASRLVLRGMLSWWLQHSLQQFFCAPLVLSVMGVLC